MIKFCEYLYLVSPFPQVLDAEVTNSILGDGCVVRGGTTIKHSVVGLRSLIGENCHIEDALIMGCGLACESFQRDLQQSVDLSLARLLAGS